MQTLLEKLTLPELKNDLLEDLKQELFLVLLKQPEAYIISLYEEKKIYFYIARILINMNSPRGDFFRLHKPNTQKEKDYQRFLKSQRLKGYCESCVVPAVDLIKAKFEGSAAEAHEARLFETYIEKRSCRQVAAHFDIPVYHVKRVISKVKKELNSAIIGNID